VSGTGAKVGRHLGTLRRREHRDGRLDDLLDAARTTIHRSLRVVAAQGDRPERVGAK
jgi:hypothetical protein